MAERPAFYLALNHYALENVFQSAKVFENVVPNLDLLNAPLREEKHDERLRNFNVVKESLTAEKMNAISRCDFLQILNLIRQKTLILRRDCFHD